MPIVKIRPQRIAARRAREILCLNDDNDIDTMNVSGINCPNENDGTTMPVINDIKEWIRNPWTQDIYFYLSLIYYHFFC